MRAVHRLYASFHSNNLKDRYYDDGIAPYLMTVEQIDGTRYQMANLITQKAKIRDYLISKYFFTNFDLEELNISNDVFDFDKTFLNNMNLQLA